MNNTQAAALIIGGVMPFVITVVKQVGFPKWANLLISAVLCAGAGFLTVWAAGQWSTTNILVTIGLSFGAAQSVYAAYWKGTRTEGLLNQATSVVK